MRRMRLVLAIFAVALAGCSAKLVAHPHDRKNPRGVVVGVPARVVRSRKPAATASLQGLPHAHTPGPDGGRSVRSEPEA